MIFVYNLHSILSNRYDILFRIVTQFAISADICIFIPYTNDANVFNSRFYKSISDILTLFATMGILFATTGILFTLLFCGFNMISTDKL